MNSLRDTKKNGECTANKMERLREMEGRGGKSGEDAAIGRAWKTQRKQTDSEGEMMVERRADGQRERDTLTEGERDGPALN